MRKLHVLIQFGIHGRHNRVQIPAARPTYPADFKVTTFSSTEQVITRDNLRFFRFSEINFRHRVMPELRRRLIVGGQRIAVDAERDAGRRMAQSVPLPPTLRKQFARVRVPQANGA